MTSQRLVIRNEYLAASSKIISGKLLPTTTPASSARHETVTFAECRFPERIEWFDDLKSLFTEGCDKGYITNIIVHGSYGDGTFCPYSDLDITVKLSQQLFSDPPLLHAFAKWNRHRVFPFLVKVDPHQHHGVFFLWDELQSRYSEAILPLEAYSPQNSWSFVPDETSFDVVDDGAFTCLSTQFMSGIGKSSNTFFRYGYCAYQVKRFLSNVMLVPVLYYSDQGLMMPKVNSFPLFYGDFGTLADPIRRASDLRKNWRGSSTVNRMLANATSKNYRLYRSVQNLYPSPVRKAKLEQITSEIGPLMEEVSCRIGLT